MYYSQMISPVFIGILPFSTTPWTSLSVRVWRDQIHHLKILMDFSGFHYKFSSLAGAQFPVILRPASCTHATPSLPPQVTQVPA
jgi:hypothetical protein